MPVVAFWQFSVVASRNAWSLMPNVRAKQATAACRTGQQAQKGPQAQRLMADMQCCPGSA